MRAALNDSAAAVVGLSRFGLRHVHRRGSFPRDLHHLRGHRRDPHHMTAATAAASSMTTPTTMTPARQSFGEN